MLLFVVVLLCLQLWLQRLLIARHLFLTIQLRVYSRRYRRVSLSNSDRFLLGLLSRFSPRLQTICAVVKPETLVGFHRALFRLFWRWISRTHGPGHPGLSRETVDLIRRMVQENPLWTPARVLGELRRLGHAVSLNTVRKYMKQCRPVSPGPGWKEFFSIHRQGVAAMDFFTVPSWNFVPYYVFFIIDHSRRSILWLNVTANPDLLWLKNQFREAFTQSAPRILISDNDPVFRAAGRWLKECFHVCTHFTSFMSPWQNGVAERWVRTVRRELTDHVIPLSEQHLRKMLLEYVQHYNQDRTHTTLGLNTPARRPASARASPHHVIRLPKVRGLSSKYVYRDAA